MIRSVLTVDRSYDQLAAVYEALTPPALHTPEGNVAAFDGLLDLPPGARVLDCACGTGWLAVGLALRGYDVDASDLSPAMVERTRRLAEERAVEVNVRECAWEDLDPGPRYAAVFCIGNSLAHARDRVRAL